MESVNSVLKKTKQTSKYGDLYFEYQKALENEKFKTLVNHLNIDSKVLMKYTSLLEESSEEYHNCNHCKSIVNCKNKIKGYAYLPKINDKNISFNYTSCKKKQKLDKDNKYQKNVFLYELPIDIKNAKITDIYTKYKERYETITFLNDFIKSYDNNKYLKGLFLHGNFGCGKTYLIAATFNELAKKSFKSAIIFWPEFLRDLKTSFQTDFKEKFENIKKIPLLLIDDIGAENTTAWGRDEILGPLLQYRMDEHLTTFFTSNLDIESLEEHFSITNDSSGQLKAKRLIERIKYLTTDMEMISNNLRG